MKISIISLSFILLTVNTFANFTAFSHRQNFERLDTIYTKKKIFVGSVLDIDLNTITLKTTNQKTIKIPLSKVRRAYLLGFDLPKQLERDTLKIGSQIYIGKVLYFNFFTGKILFLDYKSRTIENYPFYVNQSDKFLSEKLKFYKYNCYNSLFMLFFGFTAAVIKILLKLDFYIVASVMLFLIGILGFIIFCEPYFNYKKFIKSQK